MTYNTLKSLNIPYEIEYTDRPVEYLMRVAECRPFFLDHLSKPLATGDIIDSCPGPHNLNSAINDLWKWKNLSPHAASSFIEIR